MPTSRAIRLKVQRIQRFCLHDGPGIRTTVFAQGCTLRCWWCHNPETRTMDAPEAAERSIDDLAAELERDRRFFIASGGGVTVSGGEPLAQPRAVAGLLDELGRRGIHRTVDTAGHVPREAVMIVAPRTDLWLWDIKHTDAGVFREAAGGDVDRPLDNLRWLLAHCETPVRVRVPVIAGFNDNDASLAGIARRIASLPRPVEVDVLRGHDVGRDADARRLRSAAPDGGRYDNARRRLLHPKECLS